MANGRKEKVSMSNVLMVISPYWSNGTWVFDDDAHGLIREPFVAGVPDMINELVEDDPNAKDGFRLIFSTAPFPEYQRELIWVREEMGGNWYTSVETEMGGWLCPAMDHYFDSTPEKIFVKAESLR